MKKIDKSEFADPENRRFFMGDAAHVRTAIMLLWVYAKEDEESFRKIYLALSKQADKFNISLPDHLPRNIEEFLKRNPAYLLLYGGKK